MESKSNLEVKVGSFIFIGLIILTILIFSIKEFYFLKPGYNIRAVFSFVSGIQVGAPVRLAGVEAGEVEDIGLFYDQKLNKTQVEISVYLRGDAKIPLDSRVYISSLGLLGERYLEIMPGEDYTRLIKEGDTLSGIEPVSVSELAGLGYQIGLRLDETVKSLNTILGKMESGEGTLGRILYEDGLYENLDYLLKNVNSILDKVKSGEGTLGRLISGDELYQDLAELLQNIKENPWKLLRKSKGKTPSGSKRK